MTATAATRLLSPMKRRIYPNAKTGIRIATAGPAVKAQREGYREGESDPITWSALQRLGWTPYDGPAQTDENGYIIRGTDPRSGL